MAKSCVNNSVREDFKQREKKVLQLIQSYQIQFHKVGIFGSYARNDYKATSDIDFCIVTDNRPDRVVSGSLREDAELFGADVIFVSTEYFSNDNSNFARQLRADFRRVL